VVGAEEPGLIGSTQWVNALSDEELAEIALYLNFDMVGSPNYIFMVDDANESSFVAPVPVPEGSEAIEATFESFYTYAGEPYDDTQFSGRSEVVHPQRHPVERPVHRCRTDQDAVAGVDLGRNGRAAVRPLLPPGLRHLRQQQ